MTIEGTRKPTIRDVAAAAGVSRGTVSRVINGGHWVSPTAREAVERAIESTGYYANHHARSLATGRTDSIAFLLTEPTQLLFDDPTFSILLRGAAEAAAKRHKTLVLLLAGTAEERANVAHFVGARHVDGVLLISSHERDPMIEDLIAAGVPTVACGLPLGHQDDVVTVSIDEIGAARAAVRHLTETGRSRIAMISGPSDTPGGKYRLVGYQEELGDAYDTDLVDEGDYSAASGAAAMERILEREPDVDAVFAASDRMAAGAIQTLRRRGKAVPTDVAVVGFDDAGFAERIDPPLTTMRQPFDEISEQMVELVTRLAAGKEAASSTLPATLVRREST
ncbi:LacI family DNA-binding transcriptional regulator [Demequina sp. NBRC 110056]|uniref:LacI family DNA-binding transcriptional regulator n=1 Tax=Demequina sp. NBRC 110056 TaxID=1570345 RepID=UPI0011803222|nr:LacI family DNA-binding transcriptional regulator [Demequina sp. NBRC 110056]